MLTLLPIYFFDGIIHHFLKNKIATMMLHGISLKEGHKLQKHYSSSSLTFGQLLFELENYATWLSLCDLYAIV
jgi:hypothetical protein